MKIFSQLLVLFMVIAAIPQSSRAISNNMSPAINNGATVKQSRNISSFHALNVSGGIDVILTQGNDIKVEVEADENIISKIITEVEDGTLKVYPGEGIRNAKVMKVYISFKDLDAISAAGGCDINSTNKLTFSKLQTKLSGGCDIDLELKAGTLACDHTGGCDAEFNGEADICSFAISGGSDLDGKELKVAKCTINATGGSDAIVNVSDDLTINAVGASDVTYLGSPAKVVKNAIGGSDIHQQ